MLQLWAASLEESSNKNPLGSSSHCHSPKGWLQAVGIPAGKGAMGVDLTLPPIVVGDDNT